MTVREELADLGGRVAADLRVEREADPVAYRTFVGVVVAGSLVVFVLLGWLLLFRVLPALGY